MLEGVTASSGVVNMVGRADTGRPWYIPGSGIQSVGIRAVCTSPRGDRLGRRCGAQKLRCGIHKGMGKDGW